MFLEHKISIRFSEGHMLTHHEDWSNDAEHSSYELHFKMYKNRYYIIILYFTIPPFYCNFD